MANEALLSLEDRHNIDLSLAMSMEAQGSRSLHNPLDGPGSSRALEPAPQPKRSLRVGHARDSPVRDQAASGDMVCTCLCTSTASEDQGNLSQAAEL